MLKRHITLFIIIDALGWELVRSRPFLDDIAVCRQPVQTIFGFSSAAIPSILTGKYPDEHGRWNLLYHSPETSPFAWTRALRLLPRPLLENRASRKLINTISKRLVKADGYFSGYVATDKLCYFDICEKYNIYKPGGIAGSRTVIDELAATDIPHRVYSYHDHSDQGTFAALERDISAGNGSVFFAYLPELDAFLHLHCDKPDLITEKIAWYENNIRRIIATAEASADSLRWFVFSDHGMTPITGHYDLIGDLRRHGIDLDNDCLAVFDSTMARFWPKRADLKDKILKVLAECPCGRVLPPAELASLHVLFPDGRYGDIIFLMEPGTLIFPNLFGSHQPAGMHGFHPDDRHSFAAFLSNVPDYDPKEIVDFYRVMHTEIDRVRL